MIDPLADRELAILRLLPAPAPLRELASLLFVTPNTLKRICGRLPQAGRRIPEEAGRQGSQTRAYLASSLSHAFQPVVHLPGETWNHDGEHRPGQQPAEDKMGGRHHAGSDGNATEPHAQRPQLRTQIEQGSQWNSHVSFGKITKRCRGMRKRTLAAPVPNPSDWAVTQAT
jgi:hypothetical protein